MDRRKEEMNWIKSIYMRGALSCALGALMMSISKSTTTPYPMQNIVLAACAWAGIIAGILLLLCSGLALWNYSATWWRQ